MGFKKNIALALTLLMLAATSLTGCQPQSGGDGSSAGASKEVAVATVNGGCCIKNSV